MLYTHTDISPDTHTITYTNKYTLLKKDRQDQQVRFGSVRLDTHRSVLPETPA